MTMLSPEARRLADLIRQLDATDNDCRIKISDLRARMDGLCDRNDISLGEWRLLVDSITVVRSLCEGANDLRGHNGTSTAPAGFSAKKAALDALALDYTAATIHPVGGAMRLDYPIVRLAS